MRAGHPGRGIEWAPPSFRDQLDPARKPRPRTSPTSGVATQAIELLLKRSPSWLRHHVGGPDLPEHSSARRRRRTRWGARPS